jgi:photosystem II stability/assembly factor-like uncharacterized protein
VRPQKTNTDASLHGLSIAGDNVVWASGTGGTFVRTTDGGETWHVGTVAGAEKLDFRDVYAIDGETAFANFMGDRASEIRNVQSSSFPNVLDFQCGD